MIRTKLSTAWDSPPFKGRGRGGVCNSTIRKMYLVIMVTMEVCTPSQRLMGTNSLKPTERPMLQMPGPSAYFRRLRCDW